MFSPWESDSGEVQFHTGLTGCPIFYAQSRHLIGQGFWDILFVAKVISFQNQLWQSNLKSLNHTIIIFLLQLLTKEEPIPFILQPFVQRWEFIKENKKVIKKENTFSNKKSTKKMIKKWKKVFSLSRKKDFFLKISWSRACFLSCFLFFLVAFLVESVFVLFSYFLFFLK